MPNLEKVVIMNNEPGEHKTIDKLISIIEQLQAEPKDSIDVEKLQQIEDKLEDILLTLQFELKQAKNKGNWDLVNTLRPAMQECKYTIDSIRAAIINKIVIGVNADNLQEMQQILQDLEAARQTQTQINVVIGLFGFLRRIVSGRIVF